MRGGLRYDVTEDSSGGVGVHALDIEQVHKTYDNGFEALKGISLQVQEGDFYGLLGPNGAGKTTLISIVASLIGASSGHVRVFGHDLQQDTARVQQMLGLVPQEFNMNWHLKVRQIVETHAGYFGVPAKEAREKSAHFLDMLGLWDKRDQNARSLSGGMKRRLMIARAMMHHPKLLLLDEPTAGVDVELKRATWACLRQMNAEGVTIILTTHNLEEAENLCNNLGVIHQGQLIEQGNMQTLMKHLHAERVMLEVSKPLPASYQLQGFACQRVSETVLEVCLNRGTPVHHVFDALQKEGRVVANVWKKTSRLEEIFLDLIEQHKEAF